MENIYKQQSLKEQSFLQKLLKQQPSENAFIELNNLLATNEIREISLEKINQISYKYKINLTKKFSKRLLDLYSTALKHFLIDRKLSDSEIDNLKSLKQILNLTDSQIESIHNQLTSQIYEESYKEAISDGHLSEEEKQFLENLQKELRLPENLENKISDEVRSNYMNNFMEKVLADERLSPDEVFEMETITKNLNINMGLDEKTKAVLERYKLFWFLENGEIPTINTILNLQRGEECYFKTTAEWYELRTITKRINYGGPTARVKIMKGVYYRVGSVGVNRVTSTELKLINRGTLYLTNKRLIFTSSDKNSTIKLEKILSFTPYSDGIELEKETGKNPTIMFNSNVEMFCIILSRLLKEN